LDVLAGAHQEMTATVDRQESLPGRPHNIEAVATAKPAWQARQQAHRQFPFRLPFVANGRRHGIVQSHFQQHARDDLGKGARPRRVLALVCVL